MHSKPFWVSHQNCTYYITSLYTYLILQSRHFDLPSINVWLLSWKIDLMTPLIQRWWKFCCGFSKELWTHPSVDTSWKYPQQHNTNQLLINSLLSALLSKTLMGPKKILVAVKSRVASCAIFSFSKIMNDWFTIELFYENSIMENCWGKY